MKKTLLLLLLTALGQIFALTVNNTYSVKSRIKNPIPAEKTAEKELKTYLAKIFGSPAKNGKRSIFLQYSSQMGKEEFRLSEDKQGNILITGGRPRGVLYGSYYFLDRKLGVRWLTPDTEVVPKAKSVNIGKLAYHGKPVFNARILQTEDHNTNTDTGRRWRARNLFNSGFGASFPADPVYGEELIFSPPAKCHALFRIVTPAKYFKTHPEFWALQYGKRTHRDKRGLTADYCLTNEKLAQVTITECRTYLKKNPTARYISIQEGDFTRGFCDCAPCKKLVKKHGNRESARWVFFANRVARGLKKEFPHTQFLIFAYAASRRPPVNIKAEDNVCVQLCAWGNRRGMPYNAPENRVGREFIQQIKTWKKVCKNILLWDYTYGFGDRLMQTPDLLNNAENFQTYARLGIDGIFPENGVVSDFSFAMPLRAWLLTRLMWDPAECGDLKALIRDFCNNYFGKKSGKVVADYYILLCEINRKQKFVNVATGGGTIGNANFLSPAVTIRSYTALKKALNAEKNAVYRARLEQVLLPVQYQIMRDHTRIAATGKIKSSMEEIAREMTAVLDRDKKTLRALILRFKQDIRNLLKYKDIKATASIIYSKNYPARAYDGDVKTCWHAASGAGWCQIEFDKVREISRITTVLGNHGNLVRGENAIQGSLDGKKFFDIVPRRKFKVPGKLQWTFTDDKLAKPVKAKFIRTRCFSAYMTSGRRNDVLLHEQYFNLKELPKELKQPRK